MHDPHAMVWQRPMPVYAVSTRVTSRVWLPAPCRLGLVYPEMDYAGCLPGRYDETPSTTSRGSRGAVGQGPHGLESGWCFGMRSSTS